MDRRTFIRTTLVAGLGAPAISACRAGARLAPPNTPTPSPSFRTAIELGGRFTGWANAFGASQIPTRGIADYVPGHPPPAPNAPRLFRDLVIEAGADMSPAFYAWAGECLEAGPERPLSGAIVTVDASGHEIARRAWRGHVNLIEFPALARADCSPAWLRVRIAVEDAHSENPRRQTLPPPAAVLVWRRCDFSLLAGDLRLRPASIAAISCRRQSRIGPEGQVEIQPPVLGPLTIALPADAARRIDHVTTLAIAYLAPSGRSLMVLAVSGLTGLPSAHGTVSFAVGGGSLQLR